MLRHALLALLAIPPALAAPVPRTVVTPATAANPADLRLVKEVERRASSVQLGPASGQLTLVHYARSVEVVDDAEFNPVPDSPTALKPMCLAASADGKYRACVELKAPKYLLEDVDGKKTTEIEFGGSGRSCAFSPDGKTLAIGYNVFPPGMPNGFSEARLYDVATGKLLHTLEQDGQGGLTPVFSRTGRRWLWATAPPSCLT